MENRLNFTSEKVQTLTLEQLKRTHKENDIYDKPLKGIYHFELLERIRETCNKHGFETDIYDLFAAQNNDKNCPGVSLLPILENKYGKNAVEAHILRRIFANIRITNFDDDTYTTNIAVAFHQKGIQVGFGNMVKVCHNQCLLNPTEYIATYSDKIHQNERPRSGITAETVLSTIDKWLSDAEQKIIAERSKIEKMNKIVLDAQQVILLIGMLNAIRVRTDTRYKAIREPGIYPLNQTQLNKFTEDLLLAQYNTGIITAWDVYNTATELYKGDSMDIPAILPQNKSMIRFLETFCGTL